MLQISAQHSELFIGHEDRSQSQLSLAIGPRSTAHECLQHTPALPKNLENANFAIQEQIALAHISIPPGAQLYSSDPNGRRIVRLLRDQGDASQSLRTDAVECGFKCLVNVGLRRPFVHEALALNVDVVATVLLLRELLHHPQFF